MPVQCRCAVGNSRLRKCSLREQVRPVQSLVCYPGRCATYVVCCLQLVAELIVTDYKVRKHGM